MWKGKNLQPPGQWCGRLPGFSGCSGLSFRLLGLSSQRLGLSFQLLGLWGSAFIFWGFVFRCRPSGHLEVSEFQLEKIWKNAKKRLIIALCVSYRAAASQKNVICMCVRSGCFPVGMSRATNASVKKETPKFRPISGAFLSHFSVQVFRSHF